MCLGIPACIVAIAAPVDALVDDELKMATVAMGGIQKSVCIEHVPDVVVGDWVLVHVGFALAVIDEVEARRIFELLTELDSMMGGAGDNIGDVGDVGDVDQAATAGAKA